MTALGLLALGTTITSVQRVLPGRRLLAELERTGVDPTRGGGGTVAKEQGGPRGFHMDEDGGDEALPEMSFAASCSRSRPGPWCTWARRPRARRRRPEPNLPLARQTIDILELLERKTRGNLDPTRAAARQRAPRAAHEVRRAHAGLSRLLAAGPGQAQPGSARARAPRRRLPRDRDRLPAAAALRSARRSSAAARAAGVVLSVAGAELPTDARQPGRARGAEAACAALGVAGGSAHRGSRSTIPVAAGLGGGSSDAALTLLGRRGAVRAQPRAPHASAWRARLGADVPFFLDPRPAIGRGIGDAARAARGSSRDVLGAGGVPVRIVDAVGVPRGLA